MNHLRPDTRIHNPAGVRIQSAVDVSAPAADTWALIGNFGGFERFIPALECIQVTGTGDGQVRNKTFKDGNFAIEQLNTYDDVGMSMTWTLIHTSLPVGNLWAAMQVEALDEAHSRAVWTIQAEPLQTGGLQDAEAFKGFLQAFADGAMAEAARVLSAA